MQRPSTHARPGVVPLMVGPLLVGLAAAIATAASAATIVEVNRETHRPLADCAAAWKRLAQEYRQKSAGACKDAGGVRSVAEPTLGKKPVGAKFICTLKARITCNK